MSFSIFDGYQFLIRLAIHENTRRRIIERRLLQNDQSHIACCTSCCVVFIPPGIAKATGFQTNHNKYNSHFAHSFCWPTDWTKPNWQPGRHPLDLFTSEGSSPVPAEAVAFQSSGAKHSDFQCQVPTNQTANVLWLTIRELSAQRRENGPFQNKPKISDEFLILP